MTAKIALVAAIVLNIAFGTGFGQFVPNFARAGTTVSNAPAESQDIAFMSASRKVRCIMPLALRKYCEI